MQSRNGFSIRYILNLNHLARRFILSGIGNYNVPVLKIIIRRVGFSCFRKIINFIEFQRNNLTILYKDVTIVDITNLSSAT